MLVVCTQLTKVQIEIISVQGRRTEATHVGDQWNMFNGNDVDLIVECVGIKLSVELFWNILQVLFLTMTDPGGGGGGQP